MSMPSTWATTSGQLLNSWTGKSSVCVSKQNRYVLSRLVYIVQHPLSFFLQLHWSNTEGRLYESKQSWGDLPLPALLLWLLTHEHIKTREKQLAGIHTHQGPEHYSYCSIWWREEQQDIASTFLHDKLKRKHGSTQPQVSWCKVYHFLSLRW